MSPVRPAANGRGPTMRLDLLRAARICGLEPNGRGGYQYQLFYCVWTTIGRVATIEALQRSIEDGVVEHGTWFRPPGTGGVYALTESGYRASLEHFGAQPALMPLLEPEEVAFSLTSPPLDGETLQITRTSRQFSQRLAGRDISGVEACEWIERKTGASLRKSGGTASRQAFNYGIGHGWSLAWSGQWLESAMVPEESPEIALVREVGGAPQALRRIVRTVLERQGQPRFRRALIDAYNGTCAVTHETTVDALEAAHLHAYAASGLNSTANGILLRADIHNLFDLDLLRFYPASRTIAVHPRLKRTSYAALAGQRLHLPDNPRLHPDEAHLAARYSALGSWPP